MTAKFRDYYETLGVARGATPEEIKLGFRKLARIHHPDVAKDKVAGEKMFKELNEAYEVLGDPEKRRRYDQLGADWEQRAEAARRPHANPGAQGFEYDGTGFSDFFEAFFGGGARGAGGRARTGGDVEADLLVTLEEASRGASRRISLRRPMAAVEGGPGEAETRTDTYQVRIPRGVHEGQRIRLAGQGEAGVGGAGAGDLLLRVRLARHPEFTVEGRDLHRELDLAPWEAALGVEARVPTLDGAATLRVPAGSEPGGVLRLRGQGMMEADGGRGDLLVTLRVRTPQAVTPEERGLWDALAKGSSFRARGE